MNMLTNIQIIKKSSIERHGEQNQLVNLQKLIDFCMLNQSNDSQKLIASLLLKAIENRFNTGIMHEHIYLKNDDVPQIQLFNILIEKFPFVKYSQLITNNAMLDSISNVEEATIIDIGIGQGTQMTHVIELAKQYTQLKKLHIIGIEPFKEALLLAEHNILSLKRTVPFELAFSGYHSFIEDFDFNQIKNKNETSVVNASLALHHIQKISDREKVIASVKQLNPKAFILIEPNVDHFEHDFETRFMNCYTHYYNIFRVIDRLDIDTKDKIGLKLFFGREIEDVIGKAEKDRFEKHEKAMCWIDRLKANGFNMSSHILSSPVDSESGVAIKYHSEGFLGFTHETETVLAVMYAH